jgi:hypothetical protein
MDFFEIEIAEFVHKFIYVIALYNAYHPEKAHKQNPRGKSQFQSSKPHQHQR